MIAAKVSGSTASMLTVTRPRPASLRGAARTKATLASCRPAPLIPTPRRTGARARVEQGQVRILEQVKFKTGSATILPESDAVLDAVAKVLKEHTEIKAVRVEGHTDNRGGKAMNKKLSTKRAASVATWLITKGGMERAGITSQGFGRGRSIGDNRTEEGRRDNRRVEFHIEQ